MSCVPVVAAALPKVERRAVMMRLIMVPVKNNSIELCPKDSSSQPLQWNMIDPCACLHRLVLVFKRA